MKESNGCAFVLYPVTHVLCIVQIDVDAADSSLCFFEIFFFFYALYELKSTAEIVSHLTQCISCILVSMVIDVSLH